MSQGTVEQWSECSATLVARMQWEGSADPRAPGKQTVGSRLGFGSSFILCRTLWQAAGGYARVKLLAI